MDERGLYKKYTVINNQRNAAVLNPCFVLEVRDTTTWPAIKVWADTVEACGNFKLAKDVREVLANEIKEQQHE